MIGNANAFPSISSSIARITPGSSAAAVAIGNCSHTIIHVEKPYAIAAIVDAGSDQRRRQNRYVSTSASNSFSAACADRVADRQRQRDENERRERRALAICHQWIA